MTLLGWLIFPTQITDCDSHSHAFLDISFFFLILVFVLQ